MGRKFIDWECPVCKATRDFVTEDTDGLVFERCGLCHKEYVIKWTTPPPVVRVGTVEFGKETDHAER